MIAVNLRDRLAPGLASSRVGWPFPCLVFFWWLWFFAAIDRCGCSEPCPSGQFLGRALPPPGKPHPGLYVRRSSPGPVLWNESMDLFSVAGLGAAPPAASPRALFGLVLLAVLFSPFCSPHHLDRLALWAVPVLYAGVAIAADVTTRTAWQSFTHRQWLRGVMAACGAAIALVVAADVSSVARWPIRRAPVTTLRDGNGCATLGLGVGTQTARGRSDVGAERPEPRARLSRIRLSSARRTSGAGARRPERARNNDGVPPRRGRRARCGVRFSAASPAVGCDVHEPFRATAEACASSTRLCRLFPGPSLVAT